MATPTLPQRRDVVCAGCDTRIFQLTVPIVPESPEVHAHHGAEFTKALQTHHARCDSVVFRVADTPTAPALDDCPTCGGGGTVARWGFAALRWDFRAFPPVRAERRRPCPTCGQGPDGKGRA